MLALFSPTSRFLFVWLLYKITFKYNFHTFRPEVVQSGKDCFVSFFSVRSFPSLWGTGLLSFGGDTRTKCPPPPPEESQKNLWTIQPWVSSLSSALKRSLRSRVRFLSASLLHLPCAWCTVELPLMETWQARGTCCPLTHRWVSHRSLT